MKVPLELKAMIERNRQKHAAAYAQLLRIAKKLATLDKELKSLKNRLKASKARERDFKVRYPELDGGKPC